ncbi:putative ATP-dependent hsl protease ATP-binding subunit hslU [Toxoplasma gondii VEG]|uniref:ATP-dependent protease ATP-binding subunit,putative n=4 Tax=Toxoplasma gondii TaxID=5811 RepID=V4ZB93_TOXGV|nr:putative ATP-dependent hsl protease ATP-binding subunit hslU [Toxoplasma gondii VEG]KFG43111.1 putative ATP-dependent hsl protease ATP-binding subunit hslU [Toxoplasma gondii p89]CEL72644.1 TPA: ATP-dependent protease ATP-binding subunit,putative [Toxoplasma gondii VEG]
MGRSPVFLCLSVGKVPYHTAMALPPASALREGLSFSASARTQRLFLSGARRQFHCLSRSGSSEFLFLPSSSTPLKTDSPLARRGFHASRKSIRGKTPGGVLPETFLRMFHSATPGVSSHGEKGSQENSDPADDQGVRKLEETVAPHSEPPLSLDNAEGTVRNEVSTTEPAEQIDDFTKDPDEIVAALDKYIVGQDTAKKSLAIALRDRWRRQQVKDEKLRREIAPNNLLLIGPSGCGKTELAKRLAAFAGAPFVKVAATRFTEVGFVGDDTSSIVHYLAQQAYTDEKERVKKLIHGEAAGRARQEVARALRAQGAMNDSEDVIAAMIKDGRLDDVEVEIDENLLQRHPEGPQDPLSALFSSLGKAMNSQRGGPLAPVGVGVPGPVSPEAFGLPAAPVPFVPPAGGRNKWNRGGAIPGLSFSFPIGIFGGGGQKGEVPQKKKVTVKQAIAAVTEHFANEMTDTETVQERARDAAENRGIVFIDEFDKLVEERSGSDSSAFRSKRVGVQRELLTLIEGTSVQTQIGVINTDHVLFIASGSFLACKPSDIIPELQGRLPIRCDLKPLTEENFVQILTETEYNLLDQQTALLATEGVKLIFEESGVREIARTSHHLNTMNANVGARRLKTVLAKVLEQTKFEAHKRQGSEVRVTKEMVEERLRPLMEQADLCKYIL